MRTIVVGPTYPFRGGISHYTDDLVKSMIAKGHILSLVSFKRQYPRWFYPGHTDRDPSQLLQGIPALYLLDPLSPATWRDTARYIAQTRPDVVIMQWWNTFWAPAYAALGYFLQRRHIPLLYLVHNVLPHEPHLGDAQLTRLALRWGEGFITWNARDQERLSSFVNHSPVELCPMPVCQLPTGKAVSRQEARTHLHIQDDVPVILFFGFIRTYKGLRYILDAVARLRDCGKRVLLIIAGECWEDKAIYRRLIQSLHLEGLVRWEDRYIPNEEVGAYFTAADILVAAYLSDSQSAVVSLGLRFGMPLVVTPSLASRLPYQPAKMRIVPPADPTALATAISSLCGTGVTHEAMDHQSDDSWKTMVQLIESITVEITRNGHNSRPAAEASRC